MTISVYTRWLTISQVIGIALIVSAWLLYDTRRPELVGDMYEFLTQE